MLSLAANALAFSPPASLSRRDVLSFGAGAVGAAAMVQFPTVANAADKPAYLMTDEEKESSKRLLLNLHVVKASRLRARPNAWSALDLSRPLLKSSTAPTKSTT